MTTIAIHQPHYLPWPGYFHKMIHADIFVFLDNVQLSIGRGYGSRNKIKTSGGAKWLTVPCLKKGREDQIIRDVEIDNSSKWKEKHLKTIYHSYSKAPYFSKYRNFLSFYETDWDKLAPLNFIITTYLMGMIDIKTNVINASLLNVEGSNTDLLINICKEVEADTYLSGKGGANYQDVQKFKEAGIRLIYSNFEYPCYDQLWGEFEPNLSILDMLFNLGSKETLNLLK